MGPCAGLSMIMGYEFILNMQMGVWHRGVCGRWCHTHTHTHLIALGSLRDGIPCWSKSARLHVQLD